MIKLLFALKISENCKLTLCTWLCLFVCLVINGTFSTNRLYRAKEYEVYHICPGTTQTYHAIKQCKNTINQDNHVVYWI